MSKITPQIAELRRLILESQRTGPKIPTLATTYQRTTAMHVRNILSNGELVAGAESVSGIWSITRTLTNVLIRALWIGSDLNRACQVILGEKQQHINRLKQYKNDVPSAPPWVDNSITTLQADLDVYGNDPKYQDPAYYDAGNRSYKYPPSDKAMAISLGILETYMSVYSEASGYLHVASKHLAGYLVPKSDPGEFSLYEEEDKSTLNLALITLIHIATNYCLAMDRFGFTKDDPAIVAVTASTIHLHT